MKIELPVDAHLPHDYVPSERLRLEMYKRLAEVRSDDDVEAIREELLDRYGEPPSAVASLLSVARFRGRARQAGLTDVTIQGKYVRFAPVDLPESATLRLNRLYPGSIVKAPMAYDAGAPPLDGRHRGSADPRRGPAGLGARGHRLGDRPRTRRRAELGESP